MSNPIEGFICNLMRLTVGPDSGIEDDSKFIFFEFDGKMGKFEILSRNENRDGNLDIKIKFLEYPQEKFPLDNPN